MNVMIRIVLLSFETISMQPNRIDAISYRVRFFPYTLSYGVCIIYSYKERIEYLGMGSVVSSRLSTLPEMCVARTNCSPS